MKQALPTLYYIHDPMCSWCWGFRPVWQKVEHALKDKVNIQYVIGGLATDSQQIMPEKMQQSIRNNWQRIQQEIPGTKFNYEFWTKCQPRRSTYPACRAVISAGFQGDEHATAMLLRIQQAYYLEAKNPSDNAVLIQLSAEMGLNVERFESDLISAQCAESLVSNLQLTAGLGVSGFPDLVLRYQEHNTLIDIDYNDSEVIVSNIMELVYSRH